MRPMELCKDKCSVSSTFYIIEFFRSYCNLWNLVLSIAGWYTEYKLEYTSMYMILYSNDWSLFCKCFFLNLCVRISFYNSICSFCCLCEGIYLQLCKFLVKWRASANRGKATTSSSSLAFPISAYAQDCFIFFSGISESHMLITSV